MEQSPENGATSPGRSRKIAFAAAAAIACALAGGVALASWAGGQQPVPAASEAQPITASAASDEGKGSAADEIAMTDKASSGTLDAASSAVADADASPTEPKTSYLYEAETAPEKSHEETVPADVEVVTELHTVCNTCKQIVDEDPDGHIKSTGHSGYTRNVPFDYKRQVGEPTTKKVVDEPEKHYLVCYALDAAGNRAGEVSRQVMDTADAAAAAAAAANAAQAARS